MTQNQMGQTLLSLRASYNQAGIIWQDQKRRLQYIGIDPEEFKEEIKKMPLLAEDYLLGLEAIMALKCQEEEGYNERIPFEGNAFCKIDWETDPCGLMKYWEDALRINDWWPWQVRCILADGIHWVRNCLDDFDDFLAKISDWLYGD